MTIKSRTVVLILGLQAVAVLLTAMLGARDAARQAARIDELADHAGLAAMAQRIQQESSLLERAAIDLAALGTSMLQHRSRLADEAWHGFVQQRLLEHFESLPESIGGGLWFEPEVVAPGRRHYGPYVFRDGSELQFTWELSTPEYDYHSQSWYLSALPRDWPRERRRPRAAYWSDPYLDSAGTGALMMTVSAPMHDAEGRVIGLATVDWSLQAMRELVVNLSSPGGQQSFLLEQRSGRFLVYSADPEQVMQSAALQPWADALLSTVQPGAVRQLGEVELAGVRHALDVHATGVGLLLGTLKPLGAAGGLGVLAAQADRIGLALLLALPLLALSWLVLNRQFRPMDEVLEAIRRSLSRDPQESRLVLQPVVQSSRNEFSPLVDALNRIYAEINRDAERLAELNQQLSGRQEEIAALNASLEQRINERTFQLEANNAELQRTVSALSRLQGQLVEAEKQGSLSRLVAGIAHDINTPIGIAVTAASHLGDLFQARREALQRAAANEPGLQRLLEDGDEGLRMLQSNLRRAAELVRSFKQISVDQSGEGRRRFDLAGYLDEVLLSLRPQFKRLPHKVELDCPRGIDLDSYPGAWAQIVTNLVMNALRHGLIAERAGHILITARQVDDQVELRVKDDGGGIPADRLPRIFEAFYTTGAGQGGSGLGLAVVRDLVEQRLGGKVEVRSEPGQGAEFIIRAPQRTAEVGNGH